MKDGKFETQAECWEALLSGKILCSTETGVLIKMKDGFTFRYVKSQNSWEKNLWFFHNPSDWSIHKEPKPMKKATLYRRWYYYIDDAEREIHVMETVDNAESLLLNKIVILETEILCEKEFET